MLATLIACASAVGLRAQSATELDVAGILSGASWEEHEVGIGVVFRRTWIESLYDAPQSICVLQVDRPDRLRKLRVACLPDAGCAPTSQLASTRRALAAVNGGFFDTKEKVPLGLLIDGGVLRVEQDEKRTVAIGIDRRERVHIEDRSPGSWPQMQHARGSWPLILRKGNPVEPQGWGAADKRHPRTAAGTTDKGGMVLLTVDGRSSKAAGMTLLELALVMQALGCETAMNLDGGGSTTMWIRTFGVVNHPSDNSRFDHLGERPVTDAICVLAPLVIQRDEQHARLKPEQGWQQGVHRDALEGDFLVLPLGEADEAGAQVTFELPVDAPGRFFLELRWPKVRGAVCEVDCVLAGRPASRIGARRKAGDWIRIDAVDLSIGKHELVLSRVGEGQLAIDAVRLVEQH